MAQFDPYELNRRDEFLEDVDRARRVMRATNTGRTKDPHAYRPWGRSVNVAVGANNGVDVFAPAELVRISEDEPDQFCVTLSPPSLFKPAAGLPADIQNVNGPFMQNKDFTSAAPIAIAQAVAVVRWGNASGIAEAEVDFSNGATFNLYANNVQVRAKLLGNTLSTSNTIYQLQGFASRGHSPTARAQRTFPNMNTLGPVNNAILPPGGAAYLTALQPTPRFAKYVSMQGMNADHSSWSALIRFYADAGGDPDAAFIAEYLFAVNPPNSQPVPIPAGAWYWQVAGQAAAAVQSFNQVVFDLAL